VGTAEAGLYSRTWTADSTFVADALADTITFIPIDDAGIFRADAWSMLLMATDDTSTVRVDYYQPGGDTCGYRTINVHANQEPRISGQLDSAVVYLPVNHATTRFRISGCAGDNVPLAFGNYRFEANLDPFVDTALVHMDSMAVQFSAGWQWEDSTQRVDVVHHVAEDTIGTTLYPSGAKGLRIVARDTTTAAPVMRLLLADENGKLYTVLDSLGLLTELTHWTSGDSLGLVTELTHWTSGDSVGYLTHWIVGDSLGIAYRIMRVDSLGIASELTHWTSGDSLGLLTQWTIGDSLGIVYRIMRVDSTGILTELTHWTSGDSLGIATELTHWTSGDSIGTLTHVGRVDSSGIVTELTHFTSGDSLGIVDTVHVVQKVDAVTTVTTVSMLSDISNLSEAALDQAADDIDLAYQEDDTVSTAGSDNTFRIDLMPHKCGRSRDTTLVAAIDETTVFYDREWNALRAEIVDIWVHGCTDTVYLWGPFSFHEVILQNGESFHLERAMVDTIIHKTDGPGRIGHSGQGVAK